MAAEFQMAGSLLRGARLKARLSQTELARRAAVTQSVISAYESGTRQPSLPMIERLVKATGYELDVRVRDTPFALEALSGPLGQRLKQHRLEVVAIAAEHHVTDLRVFGSVARGEETETSDVDLLVDVAEGVGLFDLARLEARLERLINARIDLIPSDGLKPEVEVAIHPDLVAL